MVELTVQLPESALAALRKEPGEFASEISRSISGRGRRKVNMTFHIVKRLVPKQLTGSWRYQTIPPKPVDDSQQI